MEIRVHISARTTRGDDKRYLTQAHAYNIFQAAKTSEIHPQREESTYRVNINVSPQEPLFLPAAVVPFVATGRGCILPQEVGFEDAYTLEKAAALPEQGPPSVASETLAFQLSSPSSTYDSNGSRTLQAKDTSSQAYTIANRSLPDTKEQGPLESVISPTISDGIKGTPQALTTIDDDPSPATYSTPKSKQDHRRSFSNCNLQKLCSLSTTPDKPSTIEWESAAALSVTSNPLAASNLYHQLAIEAESLGQERMDESQSRRNTNPYLSRTINPFPESIFDFAALGYDIQSPPPSTSTSNVEGWPSQVTSFLAKQLLRFKLPWWDLRQQRHALLPSDRGHWRIETIDWPKAVQFAFWENMRRFIELGHGGMATWICRPEYVEGEECPGLGIVELWCWAEMAEHLYLILFANSYRWLKWSAAQWYDYKGELIIQMPSISPDGRNQEYRS